jgi:hypothetical protein
MSQISTSISVTQENLRKALWHCNYDQWPPRGRCGNGPRFGGARVDQGQRYDGYGPRYDGRRQDTVPRAPYEGCFNDYPRYNPPASNVQINEYPRFNPAASNGQTNQPLVVPPVQPVFSQQEARSFAPPPPPQMPTGEPRANGQCAEYYRSRVKRFDPRRWVSLHGNVLRMIDPVGRRKFRQGGAVLIERKVTPHHTWLTSVA